VHAVDVLAEPELRDAIKEYSSWPTIPQVFIHGKFVGGSDIVRELSERGELEKLVKGEA
jgi:monothiol glutaredoxin